MSSNARVTPFGERALLVELGDRIDLDVNARVHALASALQEDDAGLDGIGLPVPAYASLLLPFDPARIDPAQLAARVERLATEAVATSVPIGELVEIGVDYGDDAGPDLAAVAEATGFTPDEVVATHSAREYLVFMLGFSPGFAYLGPLDTALHLPRRSEPRLRVPAGSVAIAAAQTAVYPHATAGGWHLLGRTDQWLWDPDAASPSRLRPGDRVRFVPR
jgi:KipI family sensor histidine kinase inhibitor